MARKYTHVKCTVLTVAFWHYKLISTHLLGTGMWDVVGIAINTSTRRVYPQHAFDLQQYKVIFHPSIYWSFIQYSWWIYILGIYTFTYCIHVYIYIIILPLITGLKKHPNLVVINGDTPQLWGTIECSLQDWGTARRKGLLLLFLVIKCLKAGKKLEKWKWKAMKTWRNYKLDECLV